jgi:hypothetical protein
MLLYGHSDLTPETTKQVAERVAGFYHFNIRSLKTNGIISNPACSFPSTW